MICVVNERGSDTHCSSIMSIDRVFKNMGSEEWYHMMLANESNLDYKLFIE